MERRYTNDPHTHHYTNILVLNHSFLIPVVCDIGQLLNTDRHADSLIEAAKELLTDENSSKRRKILVDLLQNLDDRSEMESREEDEDWFKGSLINRESAHFSAEVVGLKLR